MIPEHSRMLKGGGISLRVVFQLSGGLMYEAV
jgi:hypothetical protein